MSTARYRAARAAGVCVHCYAQPALPARTLCARCRIANSRHSTTRKWSYLRWLDAVLLSRGCAICGFAQASSALCNHHLDPSKKKKDRLSRGTFALSEEIIEEIETTVVLCMNCHSQLHSVPGIPGSESLQPLKLTEQEKQVLREERRVLDERLKNERENAKAEAARKCGEGAPAHDPVPGKESTGGTGECGAEHGRGTSGSGSLSRVSLDWRNAVPR